MRSKTASREPSSAPTSRPSGSPSMSASEEPIGGPSVSQSAVPSETHSKSSSTSESSSDDTTAYNSVSGGSDEITMFPKLLDSKLEKYDSDGALRSTIIKVGSDWFRKRQENLLTPSRTKRLDEETIDEEKKNALDLLDAISRSGSLSLATSELHVIIGATHSLDESAISFFFQRFLDGDVPTSTTLAPSSLPSEGPTFAPTSAPTDFPMFAPTFPSD